MANVHHTPPLFAQGFYKVIEPFKVTENIEYIAVAMRSYAELRMSYVDIFEKYYKPYNITKEAFDKDLSDGVIAKTTIVSLIGANGEFLNIPDNYIESYPDSNIGNLKHIVLSVSLGALPADIDVSGFRAAIQNSLEPLLGRNPSVAFHIAPTTTSLSYVEAKKVESRRQGMIQSRRSKELEIIELNKQLQERTIYENDLLKYIKTLEELLQANNIPIR